MSNKMLLHLKNDIPAGIVVFLVALPLCLGVALASGAPLFSGIITGIVGGMIVSLISGSPLSVSGPAAGLAAIVLQAVTDLKDYNVFMLAVMISGILQLLMGIFRFGVIASYIPSSVIKGMLASIGIVLILKQIPHLFGYDHDTEGDFSFLERDDENTFSAIFNIIGNIDLGATIIGFTSVFILLMWDKPFMKRFSKIPAPLIVVVVGVLINQLFVMIGGNLPLKAEHLVSLPISNSIGEFFGQFSFPNFSAWTNSKVYVIAITLAIVASIETLLSLEAADKLDPEKRVSPTDRELIAQGMGNTISGLVGGMPLTSVIVRTSANINAGAKTQMSSFIHGSLLLSTAMLVPTIINMIPLSALGAILTLTGYKLTKFSIIKQMYKSGKTQFLPFMITIIAILFTDLLIGIIIGLVVSAIVILKNNMENPYSFKEEIHYHGDAIKIELGEQVSFLNRASILMELDKIEPNSKVIIDAYKTTFIDYDVVEIIKEFRDYKSKAKNIDLSLVGFNERFDIENTINFRVAPTKDIQENLSPEKVLELLREGNKRFAEGNIIERNLDIEIEQSSTEHFPIVSVLSCIDSKPAPYLIFNRGLGDIYNIEIAGNTANESILGSMEYSCKIMGAKLIVVLGHEECNVIKTVCSSKYDEKMINFDNSLKKSIGSVNKNTVNLIHDVIHKNVSLNIDYIKKNSPLLNQMLDNGEIGIVGAIYDIKTRTVNFNEVYMNSNKILN
ncbi:MAG: bifunctional SulP family inorganic anion transporter/carbonic anhydrase [Candidatus Sericytochromatia bacterium]